MNTIQLDTSPAGSLCELPLVICEPCLLVSLCRVNVVDFLFQPCCLSLNLCFCSQLACLCAQVYVIGFLAGLLPYSFVNNSAVLKICGDHGQRISGCSGENFWLIFVNIFVYFRYPDCKLNLRC